MQRDRRRLFGKLFGPIDINVVWAPVFNLFVDIHHRAPQKNRKFHGARPKRLHSGLVGIAGAYQTPLTVVEIDSTNDLHNVNEGFDEAGSAVKLLSQQYRILALLRSFHKGLECFSSSLRLAMHNSYHRR